MAATSGRIKEGKYKGYRWQVYPDPSSPTGYTKKLWNPTDTTNGGRPVELFAPHDIEADREDDAEVGVKTAAAAAAAAKKQADDDRYWSYLETRAGKEQEFNTSKLDREDDRAENDRETRMDIAKLDRKTQLELASKKAREDRRQFDAEFGLSVIKTNADLRGPINAFQGFQAARASADAGFSPYAAAISGGNTAYGGGTAKPNGGAPVPLTVGTMADEIAGGKAGYASIGAAPGAAAGGVPAGGAPMSAGQGQRDAYGRVALSPEQQAQLNPIAQTFQGGLANAKQGQIENLTDNELKAFISGGDYLGYDTDSELEFHRRSRPGQRSAMAA